MEILLISPCHHRFGGWYRAYNIFSHLTSAVFIHPPSINNPWKRILTGLKNCRYIFGFKIIHIFEITQPETFFPALSGKLLGKKVILDVGDEWLTSPTYINSGFFVRLLMRLLDKLVYLFPLTVTSDYLKNKYGKGVKIINGVNRHEFIPIHRNQARKELGIHHDAKVMLAFGNTWGNQRTRLLDEVFNWVKHYDPDIQLFVGTGWDKQKLALYLGACNLVVFPTGGEPCERACFPIRVGTSLNAERVIATDTADTEFHATLLKYNCLILGNDPRDIALNIIRFFKDKYYRKSLEQGVRKAKRELDWSNIIKELNELYKRIL